jgi:hypothetical protein
MDMLLVMSALSSRLQAIITELQAALMTAFQAIELLLRTLHVSCAQYNSSKLKT